MLATICIIVALLVTIATLILITDEKNTPPSPTAIIRRARESQGGDDR